MNSILKPVYKIWLAVNSSCWVVAIFLLYKGIQIKEIPIFLSDLFWIILPVLSSALSIKFLKYFSVQEGISINISEIELADNEFLPTYLGYFFVSLGINDYNVLFWVYVIILFFVYISQMQYFNPIFLIFGYHFYHMTTEQGTKIFVIVKGKIIRNINDIDVSNIKRLNDTTYVAWRE